MRLLRSSSLPLAVVLLVAAVISSVSGYQAFDYPTANLSTMWVNSPSLPHNVPYPDGSSVRALLLRGSDGPSFAFGFYCFSTSTPCDSAILAVFIVYTDSGSFITLTITDPPQIIWSPNRNRPVRPNATVELSAAGDLLLRDSDDSLVWSTNTSGSAVVAMNLTPSGELTLVGIKGAVLWSSFDYPTDCLLPGQSLKQGQRLIANSSALNSTQGELFLSVDDSGLSAYVGYDPPQLYSSFGIGGVKKGNATPYANFDNGSIAIFTLFEVPGSPDRTVPLKTAAALQFLRLDSDGHLRLYEWNIAGSQAWSVVEDVLNIFPDNCAYPTVCGDYGVCYSGQCSCPASDATRDRNSNYFRPVNSQQINLGCFPTTPLSCQSTQNHQLLPLGSISYFNYIDPSLAMAGTQDEESCKAACLSNCSCKAAFFQYGGNNISFGYCYLPSQILSLMVNQPNISHYSSAAFIKVQVNPSASPTSSIALPPSSSSGGKPTNLRILVGVVIGGLLIVILIFGIVIVTVRRKKAQEKEDEGDDHFDQMPGMPTRFSYEELRAATEDFHEKLGEGGFGSVFEGKLLDGTRVAVKRLDGVGQGKKEFLAEVMTIGSVHHINLVRLIGFCAEKTHRLLVYEFMINGSLEKWIFQDKRSHNSLDWQTRKKIIIDIAKGLAYLHEECRHRIAHLDIKPQNILLDEKFNAKVSDFGLSKLIDRDQSQVMTRMRGTPGYLAPEWLTSIITEKVDVYSFGVVVMEIVCGRRNLDYSQPPEGVQLIKILCEMSEGGQIADLIDREGPDMELHKKEIVGIMKLSIWCLQGDFNRRPSMSMVVKVLEGSMDVVEDEALDYNFFSTPQKIESGNGDNVFDASDPLIDSILSGPR